MSKNNQKHKQKIEEADVAEVLNMHGYFFEVACRKAIEDKDNYRLLVHNYPFKVTSDKESEIDIVALATNNNSIHRKNIVLICECKREEPTKKRWVFTYNGKIFNNYILNMSYQDQTMKYIFTINGVLFPNMDSSNACYCIQQSKRTGKNDSDFTAETDTIYYACRQLMQSIEYFLFCINEYDFLSKTLSKKENYFLLPVLITTAELSRFETEPEEIDLSNGKVQKSSVKEKKVPWIHFRWYSAMDYYMNKLQHENNGRVNSIEESKESHRAFDIAVVNSDHLGEFLDSIF